jgi:hypothetical protein
VAPFGGRARRLAPNPNLRWNPSCVEKLSSVWQSTLIHFLGQPHWIAGNL